MITPPTIYHFIGQRKAVARLRVALEAAWNDGTRLPHTLMVGPPGVGKTTIAQLAAKELGVTLHERIGQVLFSPAALNGLLMEAGDKDVVFIDEIHGLHSAGQTLLYRAMEDQQVFIDGLSDKTLALPVANFALIGATTDEYSLLDPLRQRFQVVLPFQFYDERALTQIVQQRARMVGYAVEPEIAPEIASRSRGTPRLAIRLLDACYRYTRSKGDGRIGTQHLQATVKLEGLDSLGLGVDEQRYLRLLAESPGQPVRLYTIEAALGVPSRTLQSVIEPFMVRSGLIERTERGRQITAKGLDHLVRGNREQITVSETQGG